MFSSIVECTLPKWVDSMTATSKTPEPIRIQPTTASEAWGLKRQRRSNPTGHGNIFIGTSGQVYCYVTPGGV
jgi:hypothetical protein